jgi:hypothetical protein
MTTTCEGRVEDWPLSRSVSLRHLLVASSWSAGWRGQRCRALARLFRAHLGLPPCLRRPFGLKGRFLPSPATGRTLSRTLGAFPSESSLRRRRTRPGKPSKDLCFHGGSRYPQVVPKLWKRGPRFFHPTSCPARTEQRRARELDDEGRPARDRYVWSASAALPGHLRSGRSAQRHSARGFSRKHGISQFIAPYAHPHPLSELMNPRLWTYAF